MVAEAQVKGFKGIDFSKAYPTFKRRAMADDYRGLGFYRKLGYIPCDKEEESVSKVMEYAYDDWAVAHLAQGVGEAYYCKLLLERSQNYKNQFDTASGFMRPRLRMASGRNRSPQPKWATPKNGGTIPNPIPGRRRLRFSTTPLSLIKICGGPQAFTEKLDALFTASSQLPPDAPPDIAGMVGQYAHGNEPCHHMAYLYSYAGAAPKTQDRVGKTLLEKIGVLTTNPTGWLETKTVGRCPLGT